MANVPTRLVELLGDDQRYANARPAVKCALASCAKAVVELFSAATSRTIGFSLASDETCVCNTERARRGRLRNRERLDPVVRAARRPEDRRQDADDDRQERKMIGTTTAVRIGYVERATSNPPEDMPRTIPAHRPTAPVSRSRAYHPPPCGASCRWARTCTIARVRSNHGEDARVHDPEQADDHRERESARKI